jgi:hypothetical protein
MGGKKKTAIARPWHLGGIPVDTIRLEPFEERIFEDSFSNLRMAAVLTKEDFPHFAPSNSEMNQRERAARASIGYFFQYFEGRYQRAVIADALAKASALPGPVAEHCAQSAGYMLGAALWLLDYAKRKNLGNTLLKVLPPELDEDIDFATPDVDDFICCREDMLGLMTVFMERNGAQRQAFREIWGLIDRETAAELKSVFKEALLDYFDRYLEVCSRVRPSGGADTGMEFPPRADPMDRLRNGIPAMQHADMWFLMNTPMLVGAPPERIRKTLYYRRSAELMEGFRIHDPYAVCAAYLLLERDRDVLANLNMLTVNVLLCAERHLPWGAGGEYSYAEPVEAGAPEHLLRYAYRPHENAEEEELPDPDVEAGDLLTESQLFYLATGYALPRDQVPSSRLRKWFMEQGLSEARAEGLAWGAWFAFYMDEMRTHTAPDDFEDFLKSLDSERAEMTEEIEKETADSTARTAELSRQLKESQKLLYEAERNARQLREQLQSAEVDTLRDRAELSQLREILFTLRAREGQPEEVPNPEIEFPCQTKRRIVAFGGHDTWRKAIRPMLPGVRFFDREMLPDVNTIRGADVVWIQANALSHKFYYRIIDTVRKENIPVRYFGAASARKCAEQLVLDELSAEDE